jgi:sigma-B regulation protein RsbU (phosphoserine phosphatase)
MNATSEEIHSLLSHFTNDWIAGNPQAARMFWQLVASQIDQKAVNELLKGLVIRYNEAEKLIARQNQELRTKQARLDADLKSAAGIQLALLPQKPPQRKSLGVSHQFRPCNRIGGDILCFHELDAEHVLFYILDVSGHGVPAAMVTVYLSQMLQPAAGITVTLDDRGKPVPVSPARVLGHLEQGFSYQRFKQYFTMVYGVMNTATGTTEIANGGHPQPVLMQPGKPVQLIEPGGSIVGMGMNKDFSQTTVTLEPGARLVLYTDGITEARDAKREFFGEERLHQLLLNLRAEPLERFAEAVFADLESFTSGCPWDDDVTFMVLEFRGS